MGPKQERKRRAVLELLRNSYKPLASASIAAELTARGLDVSDRTIRLYLKDLAREGYTEASGRRGHRITAKGIEEYAAATVLERVGFLSAKIDQMTYRMTFDLASRSGSVVANTSIVRPAQLKRWGSMIARVFARGYAMGQLVALLPPGERVGEMTVGEGFVGFCSVCSITLNGVLLKHGVPTRSRFGGLLELRNHRPTRFVEIINYDGTTIDPLEVFIRSGMTNYVGAVTDGDGRIGASFREVPASSRDLVLGLARKLDRIGLGAFLTIGRSGQTLHGIPVDEGHSGAIMIGGLNPISILEEGGERVESRALSGLLDYDRFFHFSELDARLSLS